MTEIEEKVVKVIDEVLQSEYGRRLDTRKENWRETEFYTDLGLDSLKIVEIVMECENVFNIAIDDERMLTMREIKDLLDIINEKLNN